MSWVKEVFLPEYKDKLNGIPDRNRGDGFHVIFDYLESRNLHNYHIIETGSMRPNGTLEGDGQSTLLFDKFINYYGGSLTSIDIDRKTSEYAFKHVSNLTNIVNADSVKYLWENKRRYPHCLIYLDSYDVDFENPVNSNLHHIKELVAVSDLLRPNTLVAVDDCRFEYGDDRIPWNVNARDVGKGNFVESFMNNINATMLFNGYQKIWMVN